jgi:hypothetical protein
MQSFLAWHGAAGSRALSKQIDDMAMVPQLMTISTSKNGTVKDLESCFAYSHFENRLQFL